MFTNRINETVGQMLGMSSVMTTGCKFGVEVELEGNLPASNIPPHWYVKGEDSLRNGYEYIFSTPLDFDTAVVAAKKFEARMKEFAPVASIRCSTHIHINVLDLQIIQVYQIICLFHLLEGLLFTQVPQTRHGNLFCLRLADAERIFHDIRDSLQDGRYLQFEANTHKYSALNMATVCSIGTLEFRFLPAMWKESELTFWFRVFEALRAFGAKTPVSELIKKYDDMTVPQFLTSIFPADVVGKLVGTMSMGSVNSLLHVNYDYIYELGRVIESKKYTALKKFWNPDTGASDGLLGDDDFGITPPWAEGYTLNTPFPPLVEPDYEEPEPDPYW